MYADRINSKGKTRKYAKIKPGKCIFPFNYKNKEYTKCVDGKTGKWCPTKLTKKNTTDTWAYCVDDSVVTGAKNLLKLKSSNKKSRNNNRNEVAKILANMKGGSTSCPKSYGVTNPSMFKTVYLKHGGYGSKTKVKGNPKLTQTKKTGKPKNAPNKQNPKKTKGKGVVTIGKKK